MKHLPAIVANLAFALLVSPAAAITVYVSNEKDDTIAVLDGETGALKQTVAVGHRPRGIVLSHDKKTLYICASDDHAIQALDLKTGKVTHSLPSGKNPETFALHPNGRFLYVSNEDDNLVTVVDVEKRKTVAEIPVGVEPEGVGASPDGRWVVATSETTNMAHWIDTKTNTVIGNVPVDSRPRRAAFTPDSGEVWVSSEIGGSVSVLDAASRKITRRITFAIPGIENAKVQPVGIAHGAKGERSFIALGPANHVAVVNRKTYEVEKYLLVGSRVWNLAFSPDEKWLYTTNGASNDVSFIDVATLKVRKSVPTGRFPWGVDVGP